MLDVSVKPDEVLSALFWIVCSFIIFADVKHFCLVEVNLSIDLTTALDVESNGCSSVSVFIVGEFKVESETQYFGMQVRV